MLYMICIVIMYIVCNVLIVKVLPIGRGMVEVDPMGGIFQKTNVRKPPHPFLYEIGGFWKPKTVLFMHLYAVNMHLLLNASLAHPNQTDTSLTRFAG